MWRQWLIIRLKLFVKLNGTKASRPSMLKAICKTNTLQKWRKIWNWLFGKLAGVQHFIEKIWPMKSLVCRRNRWLVLSFHVNLFVWGTIIYWGEPNLLEAWKATQGRCNTSCFRNIGALWAPNIRASCRSIPSNYSHQTYRYIVVSFACSMTG